MSHDTSLPNFLFLFPDQWRWDWLGCESSPYGKVPVHTPNLDALSRRGVRFTQCRSNSPLCAPARAALVAGKRMHRTGVPDNGYEVACDIGTVFNLMRDHGYRTGSCGKNDLQKHGSHRGLDGWTREQGCLGFTEAINQSGKWDAVNRGAERPQDPYMAYLHQQGEAATHVADYRRRNRLRQQERVIDSTPSPLAREHGTDDFCGRSALHLLERFPRRSPWMLWVNFPGPHEPFDPPSELACRYEGVAFPPPVHAEAGDAAPQNHQQLRRNYAAMIEGIDEWTGRLLDAVSRRGELDNTIIVFASDHGEMLGDHGRWYKSVPHEGSVHVPLIVAGPGVQSQAPRGDLVELIDVAGTFLELAGLEVPADWDAKSLAPLLRGDPPADPHREVQVAQLKDWRMIYDGRYKLVCWEGGGTALYDLHQDPSEGNDIATTHPDRVTALSDRLELELFSREAPPDLTPTGAD